MPLVSTVEGRDLLRKSPGSNEPGLLQDLMAKKSAAHRSAINSGVFISILNERHGAFGQLGYFGFGNLIVGAHTFALVAQLICNQ